MSLATTERSEISRRLLGRILAHLLDLDRPPANPLPIARQTLITVLLDRRVAAHGLQPLGRLSPEFAPPATLPTETLDLLSQAAPGDVYQDLLGVQLVTRSDHNERLLETFESHRGNVFLCENATDRRNRGSYYTPETVVEALVEQALTGLDVANSLDLSIRLLDPSVGDGRFLVAAGRWILRQQPDPDETVRRTILDRCLYGIDLDPIAVEIARSNLWIEADLPGPPPAGLARNVLCGDGLLPETTPELLEEDFDVVLGNPPFGSFSGRQSLELDDQTKQRYLAICNAGRWNTIHGLFVRRGMALSRHTLALVVPEQVGHLDGYSPLRSHLLSQMTLHHVTDWGEDVFEGAVAPVMTFVARRDKQGTAGWPGDSLPAWARSLCQDAESLGSLVGDPGVHTGNCSKALILEHNLQPPREAAPVLEGRLVGRYRCDEPSRWLRLDYQPTTGEYFTIRPHETYRRARFLIRQTARYPIVGPKRGTDYFRNSLLALYEPNNGIDVHYLVGLLNSKLTRYFYTHMVRESSQRSFPQVKVRSLRALPIVWPDFSLRRHRECYESIIDDVGSLLERHEARNLDPSLEEMERRIDENVFQLYGLDQAAIAEVLEECA